ncbi:hypothetical protein [Dongia deserti]|uniref:hypothetical protein n=1 Tax=Dongia deserti TaxID=2268030 RepID=UPI0013C3E9C2|nr:hypothetical protein [Dongia deserti]
MAIAETGILEAQALLLCESIRRFAGGYARPRITVVSPRPSRRPLAATICALERLNVDYHEIEVDSCCPLYGTSYRVHSAAWIERRSGPDVIAQLDSDTLFFEQPDFSLGDWEAAARPVDVKGMCTTGPSDPFDRYWQEICRIAEVDYSDLPFVVTSIDGCRVRASYNGGLLVARRSHGLFTRTEEILGRMVAAGLRPWGSEGPKVAAGTGVLSGSATSYWGTSQAAFSLACVASRIPVRLLPDGYNFPLHLADRTALPRPLVHVHYHGLFEGQDARSNRLFDGSAAIPPDAAAWLEARLPLAATQKTQQSG